MDEVDNWIEKYAVTRPFPIGNLAERFEHALDAAEREEDLQRFLSENPFILAEQLPHCHYVIPKFRFGGTYVSDFLLPEHHSGGTVWVLVELEPVNVPLITKSGHLSERVRNAVQQVKDWRDWLMDNRDEAIRPRSRNGLGLERISGIWSWVVAGRRSAVSARFNQLRDQIRADDGIEVMTYDRLLEWFRKRADHWQRWDQSLMSMAPKIEE